MRSVDHASYEPLAVTASLIIEAISRSSTVLKWSGPEMVRTTSSKAANTPLPEPCAPGADQRPCTAAMVQKRSVKAPGGAEVRRSTNRLTCEVVDQGQKRPISTVMRKTKPKRGWAGEGSADRLISTSVRHTIFQIACILSGLLLSTDFHSHLTPTSVCHSRLSR